MTTSRHRRPLALAALVALALPACTPDPDPVETVPPAAGPVVADERAVPPAVAPILGVWDLRDSDPALGRCGSASVGFRADGRYLSTSGDQVVTGRYVATPAVVSGRPGFLVVQRPEGHNGEPNCQGIPAESSVPSSPPDAFFEVAGDRARVFFGAPRGRPAATFVRRTLAP